MYGDNDDQKKAEGRGGRLIATIFSCSTPIVIPPKGNYFQVVGMTLWSNCDVVLTDPSKPSIEAFSGDQKLSTIQLPFHEGFKINDYSWKLPLPHISKGGKISF